MLLSSANLLFFRHLLKVINHSGRFVLNHIQNLLSSFCYRFNIFIIIGEVGEIVHQIISCFCPTLDFTNHLGNAVTNKLICELRPIFKLVKLSENPILVILLLIYELSV